MLRCGYLILYFLRHYLMKKYLLLFVLSGNLAETEVNGVIDGIKNLAIASGAEVARVDNRGKVRLAYPVKNNHFGYLVNIYLSLETNRVAELNQKIGLENNILRLVINEIKKMPTAPSAPFSQPASEVTTSAEPFPSTPTETPALVRPKITVDLNALDKKIDEILQQDKIEI